MISREDIKTYDKDTCIENGANIIQKKKSATYSRKYKLTTLHRQLMAECSNSHCTGTAFQISRYELFDNLLVVGEKFGRCECKLCTGTNRMDIVRSSIIQRYLQDLASVFNVENIARKSKIANGDSYRRPSKIDWLFKAGKYVWPEKYEEIKQLPSVSEGLELSIIVDDEGSSLSAINPGKQSCDVYLCKDYQSTNTVRKLDVFWTSVKQNGITYYLAPEYTMFSRGNISEKIRTCEFNTKFTGNSVAADKKNPFNETTSPSVYRILDMFAGIGYFSLPLLGKEALKSKGRIGKQLICLEQSVLSVCAFVKSLLAMSNDRLRAISMQDISSVFEREETQKLTTSNSSSGIFVVIDCRVQIPESEQKSCYEISKTIKHYKLQNKPPSQQKAIKQWIFDQAKVIVLLGDNQSEEVKWWLMDMPKVHRISLGYLPSTQHTKHWQQALELIDLERGGWLHLHELVDMPPTEARKNDASSAKEDEKKCEPDTTHLISSNFAQCNQQLSIMQKIKLVESTLNTAPSTQVKVVHCERVKSYGPRCWHIVLDVYVNRKN